MGNFDKLIDTFSKKTETIQKFYFGGIDILESNPDGYIATGRRLKIKVISMEYDVSLYFRYTDTSLI